MLDAAVKLERFAAGRSLADYLADDQLQWSVERGFEIIGEAMSQLDRVTYEVVTTDLPVLRAELEERMAGE